MTEASITSSPSPAEISATKKPAKSAKKVPIYHFHSRRHFSDSSRSTGSSTSAWPMYSWYSPARATAATGSSTTSVQAAPKASSVTGVLTTVPTSRQIPAVRYRSFTPASFSRNRP